ncbi:tetratricopeptide repeat protein, partial [bacterium]|nr:tetratricopeptide repeat protein [bacterium]
VAALVGFAAHHLLDTPMMMPAIALAGLLALVVAAAPLNSQRIQSGWRRAGHPLGVVTLPVILLVLGFYATALYAGYTRALSHVNDDDYRAAAEALAPVIAADPDMAITYQQQGYLWGVVYQQEAESQVLEQAIAAYTRFVDLEPQNAIGWANLAFLHEVTGDTAFAIAAWQRAATAAPDAWLFGYRLGRALETNGDFDAAQVAYVGALTPANRISVLWEATPLAQRVAQTVEAEDAGLIVMALREGLSRTAPKSMRCGRPAAWLTVRPLCQSLCCNSS